MNSKHTKYTVSTLQHQILDLCKFIQGQASFFLLGYTMQDPDFTSACKTNQTNSSSGVPIQMTLDQKVSLL